MIFYRTQGDNTVPVYKTENQSSKNGFKYQRIFSDTDQLANNKESQNIIVKAYRFSLAGNHKVIFS